MAMREIPIDMVELKKMDFSAPYISKEDVMEIFSIKDTKYSMIKNLFIKKVEEGFYPKEAVISLGSVKHFNVYAFLHFANNFDYFQHKDLEKRIKPFGKDTVRTFRELGVGA